IRLKAGGIGDDGLSSIGRVDVAADDPGRVRAISPEPVLARGRHGTYDDNGVFPARVTRVEGQVFLYYTGFEICEKIRYRMVGGLAVSDDDGDTFRRVSEAPVMDRASEGLFFRGGPSIAAHEGAYRAVYSAGSAWE